MANQSSDVYSIPCSTPCEGVWCTPDHYFAGEVNRKLPQVHMNKGAYLPSITICRQQGWLPYTRIRPN